MKFYIIKIISISLILGYNLIFSKIPFKDGEKLIYDLDFRIFSAGEATFEINLDSLNGKEVYKISIKMKTNSFLDRFYKIRNNLNIWVDKFQLHLLKIDKKIREKKYKKKFSATINVSDSTAIVNDKIISLPTMVMDPTAAIYYYRTLDFKIGNKYNFTSYDSGKIKDVELIVKKDKKISVPAGNFNCFELIPSSKDGKSLFKNNGKMKIWISKDDRHLPVKIEQNTNVGKIVLNLKKF